MLFNKDRCALYMERNNLDILLLSQPNNFVYATGFTAPSTFSFLDRPFLVVVYRDPALDPVAIVPSWDVEDVRRRSWLPEVIGYTEYPTGNDGDLRGSWRIALREAMDKAGPAPARIGVEERYLPLWIQRELTAGWPGAALVDALSIIRDIRAVKTPGEITLLHRAAVIMEGAVGEMLAAARDGVTEAELGRVYAGAVVARGGENISNFVLGFGPNGAYGHAIPGDRTLRPGESIRFDLGARVQGYHADTAVTRYWKQVSAEEQRIYEAVLLGQRAGAAIAGPGVPVSEIYRVTIEAARSILPDFRMEHVGHGIGVEHHENPPLIAKSDACLEPGMVINIETYYANRRFGGFGIEDTYLVTETGLDQWTGFDREILIR